PSLEPFLMISQSKVSRAVGMASRSSEIGRISCSANLRAAICQERCSLLRVKSIGRPRVKTICLFPGHRQEAGGVAPIAVDFFRDAQARIAIAVAVVQTDAGVV